MVPRQLVQQVVDASVGRAQQDPVFREMLKRDRGGALDQVITDLEPNLTIKSEEVQELRDAAALSITAAPFLQKQELAQLVKELIGHAENAFASAIQLSKTLFWFGVIVATSTVVFEWIAMIYKMDLGAAIAGGVLGGGLGFGFVYASLIKHPLDRLQNSAGNLAQLEIALFGYLDQLALLMSVSPGKSIEDTIKLSDAVAKAIEKGMRVVEQYTEYRTPGEKE